ncbi:MAG: hypothetical protein ACRD2W_22115, partial [Acidimicrobiales bacterium]
FPRGEPWDRLEPAVVEWPARATRAHALALTEDDAVRITDAWALDRLARLEPGSNLLAGVLAARAPDLKQALEALDPRLRRAFLSVAAAEAVGIDGVDLRVVADLTGVGREQRTTVRIALGHAGLATGTGEAIRTRDPSQARAAVQLMGDDLGPTFTDLVGATAEAARTTRPLVSDGAIVTGVPALAPRLVALGLSDRQAHEIATAAADAAAEALDNLLMTVLFRSRTYRNAGAAEAADDMLRAVLSEAAAKDDWAETARTYVCELSLSAATPEAALVLAGVSIADLQGLGPVSMVDARPALTRMGRLCTTGSPLLLRAIAWLGRRVTPNFDPAKSDFRRYAARADDLGVPEPTSADAVQWLGEGVAAAFAAAADDDPFVHNVLATVLPDGNLAFTQLRRTADRNANLVG